jgi:hypothetical protein
VLPDVVGNGCGQHSHGLFQLLIQTSSLRELFNELAKEAKILGLKLIKVRLNTLSYQICKLGENPGTWPLVNIILNVLESSPTLEGI